MMSLPPLEVEDAVLCFGGARLGSILNFYRGLSFFPPIVGQKRKLPNKDV